MKKMLLFAAAAVMTLAGCVKNEMYSIDKEKTGTKIAFESPFLYDNTTKAGIYGEISSSLYPQEEKFFIYAAQHDGDFDGWPDDEDIVDSPTSTVDGLCQFNGTEIAYDTSFDAWIPYYTDGSGINYYYWPQGKKLSFAAMSPSCINEAPTTVTYGKTGLKIENYTNGDAGKQYDVLFARRTMNHTAADMNNHAGEYSGIPLSFQHAMSSIHFSIDKETPTQNVYLKKITLTNVKYKGDFAEKINESAGLEYVIGKNTGNTVTPEWTVDEDKTDYIPFDAKSYGSIEFPVNPQYVSSVVGNITEDKKDMISYSLLVVPQEISDDTELVIDYSINGSDQSKSYKLRGLSTLSTGGIPGGKEGMISKWEIGHKYTYRIHYSSASEMKDIIYFSPSIEGWTDVQVVQITL